MYGLSDNFQLKQPQQQKAIFNNLIHRCIHLYMSAFATNNMTTNSGPACRHYHRGGNERSSHFCRNL